MRYRVNTKTGALRAISPLAALTLPYESGFARRASSYLLNTRSRKSLLMFELTPRKVVSNSLVDNLTALFQMVFEGIALYHVAPRLRDVLVLIYITGGSR